MANTIESPAKPNARQRKFILQRTKRANAKGRYFVLTDGYYPTWKVQAKMLEAEGKLFITNGKIRLIDVDIDAVRAELKAKASAPKAKKVKKAKVVVAQETAPAGEQAPVEQAPEVAPVVPTESPVVEQPAVETQAPVVEEVTEQLPVSIAA